MLPRGIRNNNPLNIRVGNAWLGEVSQPTDTEFEQFVSLAYGLRAGFILLRRYIERYKLNTVSKIIRRWAPSVENDTRRYIERVCLMSGLHPDEELIFSCPEKMQALVDAMVHYECGCGLPMSEIEDAYNRVRCSSTSVVL